MTDKLDDREIIAVIDKELQNAVGQGDNFAQLRADALDYYMGNATGRLSPPDVDGRSKVVDKSLMEAIDWVMPSFMRLFCGSDQVVRFEADSEADEKGAEDASMFVNHVIHEQNNGFVLLHDAIKNALLQRVGIIKVYMEEASDVRQERYDGISALDVQALQADKRVEIVSVEQVDAELFNVVVKVESTKNEYRLEGVPPEEFRMNRDARSIDTARFVAHEVERTRSELKSMGVSDADLDDIGDEDWNDDYSEAKRSDVMDWAYAEDPREDSERCITLTEAYLRIDVDGDGISEYRRIVKAGNKILVNEEVDEHPFAMFSCILMPYQAIGLSLYDFLNDIVEIKTVLTRQMLDNVYLSNNQRTEVVEGQVNLDDLLNPRPAGIVRVKQPGMMRDITTPFIAEEAMAMLGHFGKVADSRSGATAFNAGLGGTELAGTQIGSNGYQDMANGAMQRVELMARVFAETGIRRLYRLVLKLVTQHQDRPAQMKVNGKWMQIDPREWKDQYRLNLSVGMVAASRSQQIQNMQLILQLQEQAAPHGLADEKNAYNALTRLTENMGYRDASQFFTMPSDEPKPEPPPPPEVMIAQMKIQADKEKSQNQAQIDVQVEQAKQNAQSVQAKETMQMDMAREQMRMENEKELAKYKADLDYRLAIEKAQIDAEKAIQVAHINAQARIGQSMASGSPESGAALYAEQEASMNGMED